MLDLLHTRLEEARDVIDAVARTIGMQPEESDIWLYALEEEKGKNPILKALEEMMEGEQKNAKN